MIRFKRVVRCDRIGCANQIAVLINPDAWRHQAEQEVFNRGWHLADREFPEDLCPEHHPWLPLVNRS